MARMSRLEMDFILVDHIDRKGLSDVTAEIMRIHKRSRGLKLTLPILLGVGTSAQVVEAVIKECGPATKGQAKADKDALVAKLAAMKAQATE